jgi:hypothetical protein
VQNIQCELKYQYELIFLCERLEGVNEREQTSENVG